MPLNVEVFRKDNESIIRLILSGSLDTLTASKFDETAKEAVNALTRLVILDMRDLTFISSAGVRSIFKLVKQMKAQKSKVATTHCQPQITKVFDIIKALPEMPIFTDDKEMDEYLAAMQEKILNGEDF